MKQIKCKYCAKEFSLDGEQTGVKVLCPNCNSDLYTVSQPQANKYSEQNPYHRDKPEERAGHP